LQAELAAALAAAPAQGAAVPQNGQLVINKDQGKKLGRR